jgi:hypothetical protein
MQQNRSLNHARLNRNQYPHRARRQCLDRTRSGLIPIKPSAAAMGSHRLVLDVDEAGRLIGIEFLVPDARLLPGVLSQARTSIRRSYPDSS